MIYFFFSLFYFILFGVLAFSKVNDKQFYKLLYVIVVLFWGCSYTYAPDLSEYMEYFYREVKTLSQGIDLRAHGFEEGFNVFAALSKSLISEYIFFQILLFATEMCLVLSGIRKILSGKLARVASVLLFFIYPCMLSATRQGMAIALIIYAIPFIQKGNYKKYFGLLIVAFLFHHSSAIAIPLYFVRYLDKLSNSYKFCIGGLLIADICWILGLSLSEYLDNALAIFLADANDFEKYSIYMNDEETSISNYGIAKLLEINIAYIGFVLYSQKGNNNLLKVILLLYTIIGLMLGGILAHRFLYFFLILYYVCMFIGVNALVNKEHPKTFLPISYVILSAYMFWFYIIKNEFIEKTYHFLPTGFQIY